MVVLPAQAGGSLAAVLHSAGWPALGCDQPSDARRASGEVARRRISGKSQDVAFPRGGGVRIYREVNVVS
jgi:hypothetical protein